MGAKVAKFFFSSYVSDLQSAEVKLSVLLLCAGLTQRGGVVFIEDKILMSPSLY
jgi:hypothetical protein